MVFFGLLRWLSGKESACQCRRCRFDPWSGRSPGGRNGNPLQYSCLKNPMDREAWYTTVQGGYKESDTTECIHTHTHTHTHTHYPSLSLIAYLGLKSALSEINIIYIFFLLFPCICPPSLSSPRWIVTWSVNTISLLWHKLKWKIIIYKKLNPLILLPLWFKSLIFLLRSNSSNSTTELTVITIFRGKKDLKRKQQTTVVLVENGFPYPPHHPPPLPGISE